MKNNNNLFVSGISGLLVMILIVLVRFVDVRPIGPEGTSIGLSRLNGFFFRISGVNILWYHITGSWWFVYRGNGTLCFV